MGQIENIPRRIAAGEQVSGVDERVQLLDFERLKWKLMNNDKEGVLSTDILDKVEIEYKRFLTLLIRYPGESFAPTEFMDLMWHAHILDTKNYFDDCKAIFGYYMHHRPNFGPYNESVQGPGFREMGSQMRQRYLMEFGEYPLGGEKEGKKTCDNYQCSCEGTCGADHKSDCGGGCQSCEGTCGGQND